MTQQPIAAVAAIGLSPTGQTNAQPSGSKMLTLPAERVLR